jgi:hypothetical protein
MGVTVAGGEAVGEGNGVGVSVGGGEKIRFNSPHAINERANAEMQTEKFLLIASYFALSGVARSRS